MNTLRISVIAALLSASSAYAGAEPHWTAAIGSGHASSSTSQRIQSPSSGVPSAAHWTASIGTGHAFDNSWPTVSPSVAPAPANAALHWTASIGAGHASESTAGVRSTAAIASRTRP